MPVTATLLISSCLCCSNPSGEEAKHLWSVQQQQIAAIKASPLSPEEKGKRLAPFITKGMPMKDAEKIVGQPDGSCVFGGNAVFRSRWYDRYGLTISEIDDKVDSVGFIRRVR